MNTAPPLPSIFDTQSLSGVKAGLRTDDPQAVKAAAQQFEAVFLQMLLKSMRAATPQESMFDSDQTRFYQELLDSQLSQVMSTNGGTGLARVIERQLSRSDAVGLSGNEGGFPLQPDFPAMPFDLQQRSLPLQQAPTLPLRPLENSPVRPVLPTVTAATVAASAVTPATATNAAARPAVASSETRSPQRDFIAAVWPNAVSASQTTGIPPQFLVAHAALESGWGRSEPRFADGRASHNLFGIKAGSQWGGATVEATTTEYVNGVAEQRVERFRAYPSYTDAFADYARLLSQSPRYAGVLGSQDAGSFARGLQRGGYATDPAYAGKLEAIINGNTLRQALVG